MQTMNTAMAMVTNASLMIIVIIQTQQAKWNGTPRLFAMNE
jgi:hypothetical protein